MPKSVVKSTEVEAKGSFARRVGLTPGRISQLVAEGLPVRPDGKVDVAEALAWMEANLDPRRRIVGKANAAKVSATVAEINDQDDASPSGSLVEAKTEHEWLKVQRARLELRKTEGELIERAKAERDAYSAWAMRVAPTIAAELGCDPGALWRVLDRELRQHQAQLADMPLEDLNAA